jgi:Carbohydrate-selective porin, OprB family
MFNMFKMQCSLFGLVLISAWSAIDLIGVQAAPLATSLDDAEDESTLVSLEPLVADLPVLAPPPPLQVEPKPEDKRPEEQKPAAEKQETNAFSTTTKLTGQVIFGVNAGLSGDFSRNTIFGQRTRLELATGVGNGTLTTRLQSANLGLVNNNASNPATAQTPEGTSSFAGGADSAVSIDLLKYDVPLGPNTQLTVAANAAGADDFTDSINPLFDGDGASGSISRFGGRPAIYYLVSGAGAGIRQKLSPTLEGSIGYLASTANSTTAGLAGGAYGAIAQLTYLPNENTKVGLTYVNAFSPTPDAGASNSVFGIGSGNADNLTGNNNMFGLQASAKVSPTLALGGWVGYNKNSSAVATKDVLTWAVTAAFPDLGAPGNLAGLVVGQEPRVTAATGTATADTGSSLHLEGFYQVKLSDSVSITPGLIYLTAPDQNSANGGALIGTIRTTFSF